jgi:hypothetical protein
MKTAFVASTLPALFIKNNFNNLNLDVVICANNNLLNSYSFLKKIKKDIVLIGLNKYEDLAKYAQTDLFKDIYIFHECCWLELDVLIIKYKPVVKYFPCVTLDSFTLLEKKDKNILFLIKLFITTLDRKILKLIYFITIYSKHFDIYKMRVDGKEDKYDYVTSLKTDHFINITKNNSCLECRKNTTLSKSNNNNKISKNVIFIVATDVVDNNLQIEIFKKLKIICESYGLNVYFKNHPNVNFRLPYPDDWVSISPFDPFEIIDLDYLFKVGLFSTALAFEPNKSITISELLNFSDENLEKRKSHNFQLLYNSSIYKPNSYEEFENLVTEFINVK